MGDKEILAERFQAERGHLRAVALRLLGSSSEADDAVQEAYLRLMRTDTAAVDNFSGWLTTVTARVCLDMLRARRFRHEVAIGDEAESVAVPHDAEREKMIADSIGSAMLVVLDTLTPGERVAFVLHDVFNIAFDDIAPVVGRSSAAVRQLASRARRRVQGAPASGEADRARQREVVEAFLAASRGGDFAALLAVLDPDVVLHADKAAIEANAARAAQDAPELAPEIRGRDLVAPIFRSRLKAAQIATVDGDPGLVFALGGRPRVVVDLVVENGRIVVIDFIGDAERMAALALAF